MLALRIIENLPGCRQQDEAAEDRDDADDMQNVPVWIAEQTQDCRPQVPRIVRERIKAGIFLGEPAREQIDRQREPVHLGKARDDEGGKAAEGSPVPGEAPGAETGSVLGAGWLP